MQYAKRKSDVITRCGRWLVLALTAAASLAAGAAEIRLACDQRVSPIWVDGLRERRACPEPGKAYRDDRITVVGSDFPVDSGSRLIAVYWYKANGNYAGVAANVFGIDGLDIKSGGRVVGAVTVPATLAPGPYRLLFHASTPCSQTGIAECSRVRPVDLPQGFNHAPPAMMTYENRPATVGQSSWTTYVFAGVDLEVLAGKPPEPPTDDFRLSCDDTPCREGSPFHFTTGGAYRYLREGGSVGCIVFRRKGVDSRPLGNSETRYLRDAQGLPVRVRNGSLSGTGSMPGAGTWDAAFECVGEGRSVVLGEFTVSSKPAPPPAKTKLNPLALRIVDPQPAETGGQLAANELAPGTSFRLEMSGVAWGGNYYYLAELGGVSLGERFGFGSCPDYCDDSDNARMKSGQPRVQSRRYTVPAGTPVGPRALVVRCAGCDPRTSRDDWRGEMTVNIVAAPRMPVLELPSSATTGDAIGISGRNFPPGGELTSVVISGTTLFPPAGAASGLRFGADGRFAIKTTLPYETNRLLGSAGVNDVTVTAWVRTAGANARTFTVDGKLPVRRTCEQAAVAQLVAAEAILDLDRADGVRVSGAGFGCSVVARVRIVDGDSGKLLSGPAGERTDIYGRFAIPISSSADYAKNAGSLIIEAEGAAGRKASLRLPVKAAAPKFTIAVEPRKARAGDRVDVRWQGFAASTGVVLYFDAGPLKDNILLDRLDPVIAARLPDVPAGRHRLRLVDARGNEASAEVDIEAGGDDSGQGGRRDDLCARPCLLAPDNAAQGATIDLRIAGFARNSQVALAMAPLGELKAIYQSGPVDSYAFKIPESLPDGSYTIVARSVATPQAAAEVAIRIAGARRAPSLKALPLRAGEAEVVVRAGTQSVHVSGERWAKRGQFAARLIALDADGKPGAAPATALARYTDGCGWMIGAPGQAPKGKPCDAAQGEIDHHWSVGADVRSGRYTLALSDGINEVATENAFRVVAEETSTPPAPPTGRLDPARAYAGDSVAFSGQGFAASAPLAVQMNGRAIAVDGGARAGADGRVNLRLVIPRQTPAGDYIVIVAAPAAAAARGATAAAPEVRAALTVLPPRQDIGKKPPAEEPPAKICNPDLPRTWQPGCIDKPAAPVAPPPADRKICDPKLPRLWQPGCVDGPEAQPDRPKGQPTPCNPDMPRYSQPGCVETGTSAPKPAGPAQKCRPDVPSYSQPGCIP